MIEINSYVSELYSHIPVKLDNIILSNGIIIPFSNEWKKLAFQISGGADSAILCYLILKHASDLNLDITIHTLSMIRCSENRPWQYSIKVKVMEYLKNKFSEFKWIEHETFVPTELELFFDSSNDSPKYGAKIIGMQYSKWLCETFGVNAIYGATTRNPDTFIEGSDMARSINYRDVSLKSLFSNITSKSYAINPFVTYTKDKIIQEYFKNNIADLLDITRSCEGEKSLLYEAEKKAYQSGKISKDLLHGENYYQNASLRYQAGDWIPVCGECFWCKEREFALNVNLNLT